MTYRRTSGALAGVLAACAVLAIVAMATAWPSDAHAQACCAASQTDGPARLSAGQNFTVGVGATARADTGVFSQNNHRRLNHPNYELRQTLFSGVRIGDDFQLGASAPLIQNFIRTADNSDSAVGFGDTTAQLRWEVAPTVAVYDTPGVGLVASATAPTGLSRTESMNAGNSPLQADVTGVESWRFELGLQLEWAWQHWYLAGQLAAFQSLGYTNARGDDVLPGPGANARLSVGRTVDAPIFADDNLNLAAGLTTTHRSRLWINGERTDDTFERISSLSAQAGAYITRSVHLSVSASWDLPFAAAGANRYRGASAGLNLRWVFWD